MLDTLSPTLIGEANRHFQQLAYQRLLLAQLGITPWVSRDVAYTTFDGEGLFNQNIVVSPNQKSATIKEIKNEIADAKPIISHENHLTKRVVTVSNNLPSVSNPVITNVPPLLHSVTLAAVTCRYHIQAMLLPHWILVADESVLQQDSRLLGLWQNIGNSMQAKFLSLQFPLVTQPQNLQLLSHNKADPQVLQQLFANEVSGLASFSGFIHAHLRPRMQVGYLTALPELILRYPMQALPTLEAMLDNPQLKRELWQMIKNPMAS